jgi:hypothetical protein
MKDVFTNIIKNHEWRDVPCGSGSTLEYTLLLRSTLPKFLNKHGINSMIDAPCGDYSWMNLVEFPDNFQYIGGDIVEFMIESNQLTWPKKDFRVFDLTQDKLPNVDLLFCRDCLFHLSENDILKVFDNMLSSSVKYLMTTSYLPANYDNCNIKTGGFRPINLEKAPFNLPTPIDSLDDGPANDLIRRMCLWNKNDLINALK